MSMYQTAVSVAAASLQSARVKAADALQTGWAKAGVATTGLVASASSFALTADDKAAVDAAGAAGVEVIGSGTTWVIAGIAAVFGIGLLFKVFAK